MNVPIASYYYHPTDKPETAQYLDKMKVIHKENLQASGRRRKRVALNNQGIQIGVFKITRLIKAAGIIAKVPKKPHYYPSGKQRPNIPNQLNRQFSPSQANTHWAGDITYIRHHGSWSYLATVLDLGSREIVDYALSQTPDAQLARQTLFNAI
jgi:putative transposase